MSYVPDNLKYTASHEWLEDLGNGVYRVGITEFAQSQLGDIVFVELPEVGDSVTQGDDCAVAESVKAASDIYAPLSGEVVEINDALADSPEQVNASPYTDGWMFKIKVSDESELDALLDAAGYESSIDEA